jgi:hypothetical protein
MCSTPYLYTIFDVPTIRGQDGVKQQARAKHRIACKLNSPPAQSVMGIRDQNSGVKPDSSHGDHCAQRDTARAGVPPYESKFIQTKPDDAHRWS